MRNQPVLSTDYCKKCEMLDKGEATQGEGPIVRDGTPRGCLGEPEKVGSLGEGYVVWCSSFTARSSKPNQPF